MQGCEAICMWRILTQPCLSAGYNKMDSSSALDPAVLGFVQQAANSNTTSFTELCVQINS